MLYRFLLLGYWIFVTYVSLRPITGLSIGSSDKAIHLLLYFVFALLGYGVFRELRAYYIVCVGIVGYSGLMEIAQSFIPDRFMSGYDLAANVVGVVFGGLIVTAVQRYQRQGD